MHFHWSCVSRFESVPRLDLHLMTRVSLCHRLRGAAGIALNYNCGSSCPGLTSVIFSSLNFDILFSIPVDDFCFCPSMWMLKSLLLPSLLPVPLLSLGSAGEPLFYLALTAVSVFAPPPSLCLVTLCWPPTSVWSSATQGWAPGVGA